MAASKYDFSIEQGSSFRLAIIYKDKNQSIVDITGWCARLIWTTNTGAAQVFSTQNTDNSLYNFSINGPEGKITLLFPATVTNMFNFATAKYDLELISTEELYVGGGKQTSRLLYGTVSINKRHSGSDSIIECSNQ
jgi:hypothetical protein